MNSARVLPNCPFIGISRPHPRSRTVLNGSGCPHRNLRISRSTPAGLTKRLVRTFCTILQGRAHPRRAQGIGCEAGLGLAPTGRTSRTERSIRLCRATPGRGLRLRRDRQFWVATRTGSWCVVRGVAQGHPATHAGACLDRGPALGLWAGTPAPGSGSSPGGALALEAARVPGASISPCGLR
jgi:hypothetical protein